MAGMVRVSDWDRHHRSPVTSLRLVVENLVPAYRGPDGRGMWARPEELARAMATHGQRLRSEADAAMLARIVGRKAQTCSICGRDDRSCRIRPMPAP